MEESSLLWQLLLTSLLCCSTKQASLTVHPSRSQFFRWESVSLSCEVDDSFAGWMFRRNTSEEEETTCGASWGKVDGSSCIISYIDPLDSGVYWCESTEGATSNTVNITVTLLTSLLCCSTKQASLTVHPSRSQFFRWESVSLSCEVDDSFAGWMFRRNTSEEEETTCGASWGKVDGSSCIISYIDPLDSGVYWCESTEEATSNTVNITVTHPQEVTARPGEDVTLPCQASSGVVSYLAWRKTEPEADKYVFHFRDGISSENFQEPSFRGRVELRDPEMKDGDGSVILKNVTVSDSGTYKCLVAEETAGRRKRDVPKVINTIRLDVEELGPTAGIQDDEGTPGSVASVIVSVVLAAGGALVAVAVAVAAAAAAGIIIYKKKCPVGTGHGSGSDGSGSDGSGSDGSGSAGVVADSSV